VIRKILIVGYCSALGNLFDVTAVVLRGSNLWKISAGAKMKVKYIPYIYIYINKYNTLCVISSFKCCEVRRELIEYQFKVNL